MNMTKRVVRLSVAVGVGCAALFAMAPASADVARHQMLTLQYDRVDYYLASGAGPYPQSFTLTYNPCSGTVSGPGVANIYGESLTQGLINGALITYTSNYVVSGQTDYAVKVIGAAVDLNDYSFDGKWTDNYLAVAGGQSGEVVSGVPKVTSSAYRNHGEFVAQNPTKNDAAHSCIGMPVKNAK